MALTNLSVVFLQYEPADKYPHALERLLAVFDRFRSIELKLIVVDNAREGEWEHQISNSLLQIGGDNQAWEFSAFDKGLSVFERWRSRSDVYALVTDAFWAYGDEYLQLIDDNVVRCASRLDACVGWMDGLGSGECRIGDLAYDAYMRSSFLFLPAETVSVVRPLAAELDTLGLFGSGPEQPFSSSNFLSENLKRCLLEWLTNERAPVPHLSDRWHSNFELNTETYPFFRAKVRAVLREHFLSARLRAAGIACYDFRCLRFLSNQDRLDDFLDQGGRNDWQWLGWRSLLSGEPDPARPGDSTQPAPADGGAAARATLLLAGELGKSQSVAAARFALDRLLPLVRQRHASVKLLAIGDPAVGRLADAGNGLLVVLPDAEQLHNSGLLDSCVAILAPPGSDPACLQEHRQTASLRPPLVFSREACPPGWNPEGPSEHAETVAQFAASCCRLIERLLAEGNSS